MKRRALRGVALVTLAQFLSFACGTRPAPTTPPGGGSGSAAPPTGIDAPLVQTGDPAPGLTMRLSDGRQGPAAVDHSALAKAANLSDADVAAILARVPALKATAGDTTAFALRDRSTPPPRTGTTIKGSFPPPVSAGPPPAGAGRGKDLTVLRWAPEGDVPVAPSLQLTFSHPMIAVTSQDDAAASVPVTLSPLPKGRWRWLGTRTITFDPEIRFPQSTTYTVTVPAGTKGANGEVLAAAKAFTFTTPTPRVIASWPEGAPQRLDAPMYVLFDQRVDPAAVLATLKVTAGKRSVPVRLLTADEIAKHDTIKGLVDSAKANQQDGRWLAFRATEPFPTDTLVGVTIGPGTPSAEGPNQTKDTQAFSFRTYAPLKILEAECGWGDCRPGQPIQVRFNNPLDDDRWDDALVSLTPDVPAPRVDQSGEYLSIYAATRAMTTYTLRVSGGVVDTFGQTLGKDATYKFKVGPSYPNFYGPSGLVALDPAAKKPTLDVFSSNYDGVKVQLYQVEPSDWPAFAYYVQHQWERTKPRVPGKRVLDTVVKVGGPKEELNETKIDLSAALGAGGLGHVVAIVEPSPWRERHDPPRLIAWVQSTRLALDAAVDAEDMYAWVNKLADGTPVAGAKLTLEPYGTTGTTGDDGTAKLALAARKKGVNLLVARAGDDVAFLPDDMGLWGGDEGQWARRTAEDTLVWYVTDDRQMYRPGEDVHLKGWTRVRQGRKGGDLAGITGAVTGVRYRVVDPVGNELFKGTAKVSPLGGFDLAFKLPKTPNLGGASVQLESEGRIKGSAYHGFQIQEFRRPEYEVSAQASQGPHLIGGSADVTVNASYFAGGGLQDAEVNWYLTANETTFTPPNRDDFTFGVWVPWWGWGRRWWDDGGSYKPSQSWSHAGKTDATGAHVLHLDLVSVNPPGPMSVTANATVTDVNRQGWSASSTLLVHPAAHYVGLRTARPFVDKGTPIDLEAIVVDLDGKAVPGRAIDVRAVRLDWKYSKGKFTELEEDPQSCAPTSAAAPVHCELETPNGGQYRITAFVTDLQGRKNRTELTVWVSGGDTPPAREVEQEQVQLIPSAKEYAPGDTAELLVQAPFYPAEGTLSIRRSGVVSSERFTMTGPTYTVRVPISDGFTPNLYVQVDLVGAAARVDDEGKADPALPKRPAYASGSISLPVPPRKRTLAVEVAPKAAKVGPGEKTRIDVLVKDASGAPVDGAEVAVFAVDEAVLSLSGYQFPDPVAMFYQDRESGASDHHLRAFVKLAQPDVTVLAGNTRGAVTATVADEAAPMDFRSRAEGAGGAPPPPPPPAPPGAPSPKQAPMKNDKDADGILDASDAAPAIAVRSNFDPLAAFAPAARSGKDGKVAVELTVPDNLTRYRLIAIAAAGDKQFGKGESAMTARLPVMVRPSAPRFLNFGDTFQLPVVVQNQTDDALEVSVAVRATNATLTAGSGRKVTVPANDRVEVRFPAAAELAGTARFQLVATSKAGGDAAEVALPVWTPATTEAFATYGVIDDGAIRQPVALPGKVVTQFGGLEVETSSTQLQALTDAFLYLVAYPFECAEQRASRIAAIAALRDVLSAFKAAGLPPPAALEARVAEDVERLFAMQNDDGGFPFWQRGFDSWPYLTVHVTNALLRAKAKGYPIEARPLAQALEYLRTIERRYPHYYGEEIKRTITSYALYTRMLAGDRDVGRATALIREAGGADKLPMEAAGWLLGVLAAQPAAATERAALMRTIANRSVETAGAANFTTSYSDGGYLLLASDRRVDGIVLESLIAEERGNDLIPKVVTGLLAHRKAGRWDNTQDNVFVLQALDLYFHEYEKATPDFVAKVWLGDGYAGEHAFRGRTTDRFQIAVPMKTVADKAAKGPADLVIQKDGAGRLYYRIGMTYAPSDLKLPAADYGFAVTRRYEAVDDAGDVVRQPDGSWKIKAGAKVRVRLAMVAESRRYHVALVDPMPAGLEAMNPALAVTGPIPQDPSAATDKYWWWSRTWYEHQNLRDERVEAFTSLLWEGVHEYTYVARATTPGVYVVPPTKAEEMYMPETFGRSASDKVIVE